MYFCDWIFIINNKTQSIFIYIIFTAKAGVFDGFGEAVVGAWWVALLVWFGSNDVTARTVVAHVELGVASDGVVVECKTTAYFRCLAPNQLQEKDIKLETYSF